jgi:hypothetical protein
VSRDTPSVLQSRYSQPVAFVKRTILFYNVKLWLFAEPHISGSVLSYLGASVGEDPPITVARGILRTKWWGTVSGLPGTHGSHY